MRTRLALLALSLALGSPALAQAPTHLGVPAAQLVTIELYTRVDPATGAVVGSGLGTFQDGRRTWQNGAKGYVVPPDRTLVLTDVQVSVVHEASGRDPADVELQLWHPKYGYFGPAALLAFPDLQPGATGVRHQSWTAGVAVPPEMELRLHVSAWAPGGLTSMARVVLHGYFP